MPPSLPQPPPSPFYKGSGGGVRNYTEKEYEEIFYHFDDYAQAVIMANASKFITEPTDHYDYEEEIIDEYSEYEMEGMKKSFYFGFASTVSSFVLLRWRRRTSFGGLSKYASASRSSGGYKFDPIHQQQPSSLTNVHHASNGSTKPSRFGFFTDVALSALLGMGLSLLAIENDLFYPPTGNSSAGDDNSPPLMSITPPPQWISHQIPLVPGKSIISETLCQPLTEEFRKFPKELWQSGNHRGIENGYNNHIALYANGGWKDTKYYNSNPNASVVSLGEKHNESKRNYEDSKNRIYEHLVVDSLQGFIINCERRARYENKLRKLKNIPARTYPIIPPDGVPANEELELDDIYLIEDKIDDNDDDHYSE
mmetsp:Transcript_18414/g.30079  ORF Transcript_18414/g.30079 Transcript_18414/m.30079 type:complete len:367 (+) Transcript_18414:74-1174(+)|eukprot:scaffold6210_cov143-Skeletonema_menzelii.AAC.7